jgi:hypothetical protein
MVLIKFVENGEEGEIQFFEREEVLVSDVNVPWTFLNT